jgi:hypothetical protein
MSKELKTNPLTGLIGIWKGKKGTDLAPKPKKDENNPYFETLVFETVNINIENAEEQQLTAVRYHQTVTEIESGDISHDETGYWIWDKNNNTITCAFSIPRGLSLIAGGTYKKDSNDEIIFQVASQTDDKDWGIVQSPFMKKKAKTLAFKRQLTLLGKTLSYSQLTTIDIYGKIFDHTDDNTLVKVE